MAAHRRQRLEPYRHGMPRLPRYVLPDFGFCHVRIATYLIDDEAYVEDTCEYVFMNPVRAGLCDHPADWRWSGARLRPLIER